MRPLSRRRFLAITAAAAAVPAFAQPAPLHHWRGVALGADASITLAHPQAKAIVARALAEVTRLERVFSLHRPDSALAMLNRDGTLPAPPFELLECLSVCGRIHTATGGRFDPTIQPLWALHATAHSQGRQPAAEALQTALARTGWDGVRFDAARVEFDRPGMALSLNGIAQGYIADRVADMLRREGLTDILVNTGEFRALGGHPQGGAWPVTLDDGTQLHRDAVALRDAALASSAPHGITFDDAGSASHILDPMTGRPAPRLWRLVSVAAPQAALADALSTAFCLMTAPEIAATLEAIPQARLVHAG